MADPIVRIATNPQMSEKLGLSDEQKAKLKELRGRGRANGELQKKVREATEKQARLLNAEKIDEAAAMNAVDEVFELRKEMATRACPANAKSAARAAAPRTGARGLARAASSPRQSPKANSLDGRRRRAPAFVLPRRRLVARGPRRPSFSLDAGASARPPADG